MRHKNTELMERIRKYIDEFYMENHRMPATSEIGAQFGIVKSTAYKYLCAMHDAGMLRYENGEISTDVSGDANIDMVLVPIYNESISCGPTEGVEASIRDYVSLPAAIFGKGELYIIRTYGDSMIGAGIDPEDLVVVRKTAEANRGDIIVAETETGNTLKTLAYDERKKRYYLHPENPALQDIYSDELHVQGVVSFVIKKVQN